MKKKKKLGLLRIRLTSVAFYLSGNNISVRKSRRWRRFSRRFHLHFTVHVNVEKRPHDVLVRSPCEWQADDDVPPASAEWRYHTIILVDAPRRSRSRPDVGAVVDRSPDRRRCLGSRVSSNDAERPDSASPKVNFRSPCFSFFSLFFIGTHYRRVSSDVSSPEPVEARLINEQGTLAPSQRFQLWIALNSLLHI